MSAVATMDPTKRLYAMAGEAKKKSASTAIHVQRPDLADAIARYTACKRQAENLTTEAEGLKNPTPELQAQAKLAWDEWQAAVKAAE